MQAKHPKRTKRFWLIVLAGASVTYAVVAVLAVKTKRQAHAVPYPLTTCVVSDFPLKRPYSYLHRGNKVLFCCRGCLEKFRKEPGKYMEKLDLAYAEIEVQVEE